MGLDRFQKTPCGFCFVEYYTHQDALDCMKYIGGTKLDERVIRTDLDEGFAEGRQYGCVRRQPLRRQYSNTCAGEASLVDRSETSTGTSTTPAEEATVELMRRISTNTGNTIDGQCELYQVWVDKALVWNIGEGHGRHWPCLNKGFLKGSVSMDMV